MKSTICPDRPRAITGFAYRQLLHQKRGAPDIAASGNAIAENAAAGTEITALSAIDPDTSDTFTYTLAAGDGTNDADNALVEIVGNKLQVKTGALIDFETNPSLAVRVQATDSGGLSVIKNLTFSVTNVNEAPTDIAASGNAIAENTAAGTEITALSATDPDTSDTFTYTLASRDGTNDADNTLVEIVGNKLQVKTGALIDFETNPSLAVRVQATDSGGLSVIKNLTISVTDINEAPTAIALSNTITSLAENTSTASRTEVGTITVSDDALGTNSITLSGNDAAYFEVDAGKLYLQSGVTLNFEAQASYNVTVNAQDTSVAGSSPVSTAFSLAVTNVNEAPTDIAASGNAIAENTAEGTEITALSTIDPDTSDTFTYTLASGDGSNDADNALVEIVGNKLQVKTGALIDFETNPSLAVRVKATDCGGLSVIKNLTISVTNVNEAPTLTGITFNSTSITFTASDPDSPSPLAAFIGVTPLASLTVNDGTPTTYAFGQQSSAMHGLLSVKDDFSPPAQATSNTYIALGTSGADTFASTASGGPSVLLGFAGNDTLQGSAFDDLIIGGLGADSMNGGAGNNTFVFNADIASGEVVTFNGTTDVFRVDSSTDFSLMNSGSSLIGLDRIDLQDTSATLLGTQLSGLTLSVTDLPGGATGSLVVFGGTGNDTISLSNITLDNHSQAVINGGAGADILRGTQGKNIFGSDNFGATGQGLAPTANSISGNVKSGDQLTFGSGLDKVVGFISGTDKLDTSGTTPVIASIVGAGANSLKAAGTIYIAYGKVSNTNEFIFSAIFDPATANDAVVYVGDGTNGATSSSGYVALVGLSQALQASDFI